MSRSERDTCTKFITPPPREAGLNEMLQVREQVSFTRAIIQVRRTLRHTALKSPGLVTDPAVRRPQDQQIALLNQNELFNGNNSIFVGGVGA